jgi:hypothetical protein
VTPDAGRIRLRNVYGWFERTQPGMYRLTKLGEAALQRWAGIILSEAAEEPLELRLIVGGQLELTPPVRKRSLSM